jgi:hypothetical protein
VISSASSYLKAHMSLDQRRNMAGASAILGAFGAMVAGFLSDGWLAQDASSAILYAVSGLLSAISAFGRSPGPFGGLGIGASSTITRSIAGL